jgi:hypothetical protein
VRRVSDGRASPDETDLVVRVVVDEMLLRDPDPTLAFLLSLWSEQTKH